MLYEGITNYFGQGALLLTNPEAIDKDKVSGKAVLFTDKSSRSGRFSQLTFALSYNFV